MAGLQSVPQLYKLTDADPSPLLDRRAQPQMDRRLFGRDQLYHYKEQEEAFCTKTGTTIACLIPALLLWPPSQVQ